VFKNIKHIYNEVLQEMGFIKSWYNAIKSQKVRNINKQLPSDVTMVIIRTYIKDLSSFYTIIN